VPFLRASAERAAVGQKQSLASGRFADGRFRSRVEMAIY
jgi:hypothetical protein